MSYKKNAEGLFIGKTVTYRGVTYPSVVALARAYGLKRDTCWRRYLKGLPLDMPFHTKGAVTYDGKTYASMTALAVAFGISPQLCSARLIRGIPLERPVRSGGCKPCEYGGERYESIADFARRLGLNIGSARLLIETSGRWLEK